MSLPRRLYMGTSRKSARKTIVITGASGFLGSALVSHFAGKGWQVRALLRNAAKYSTPGVTYLDYELAKPINDSVLDGADYLVHAAYMKHGKQHPDALQVNLEAAKRLIKASRKHHLTRNVFISSMSAHSGAESTYGKQKLAIENLFSGGDCTIIRSGLIMGDGGMVKQMADFMKRKHAVPLIDGGKQPLQVIAIYDLVRVIDTILAKDSSGLLTIATPEVYTYKEFYEALRKHLKTPVVFIPVPLSLLMGVVKGTSLLHLPLSINQDNVLGLKNLRSANTGPDLAKLGIKLDPLEKILEKS
jgi:nucleoside-diphosphate-sugar epimerase